MGMEVVVPRQQVAFGELLEALGKRGLRGMVVMIDGQLQMPGTIVPETWRDVRLRFPAGTITVARRPGGVAVVIFGNADPGLQDLQRQVAEALTAMP